MVIILVVTVVTSITRNTDLQLVQDMNDLQQEANLLLDDLNASRVELRTVFTSVDNVTEYTAAMEALESSRARIDQLEATAAQLDKERAATYSGVNAQLSSLFSDVFAKIDAVHSNDLNAVELLATMTSESQEMSAAATETLDLVASLVADMAVTDAEGTPSRMQNAMIPAQDLFESISNMRVQGAKVIYAQDLSDIDTLNTMMDTVEAETNALLKGLTSSEAIASTNELLAALGEYRIAVTSAITVLESSEQLVAEARAINND
jgi:hypothetical protein